MEEEEDMADIFTMIKNTKKDSGRIINLMEKANL
jgi:hypothetical protein